MYDNYIAVDWAQSNMAIARLTKSSKKANVIDMPASIKELKSYLKQVRGSKILTVEETTTAQWLYVELRECVDEIIICDPYRNKLLSEGAKNDKIDAIKLATLLQAGLLKPVFHSSDYLIGLRKLMSAYDDLIQRGVRLKNQRSSILRSLGLDKKEKTTDNLPDQFVLDRIDTAILAYEEDRAKYVEEFSKHLKSSKTLQRIKEVPGIGVIGAVKIGSIIVDAKRFKHKNNFLAYCGLVNLSCDSGGRTYRVKAPRYNRQIKSVFKTAALSTIRGKGCFAKLYENLITVKRYPDHQARHAVARKIAIAVFGTMYSNTKFNPQKIGALKALSE